ncbi:MAG TPA: hypothetical protein VI390_03550 [Methyloceanibacter sp.]
MRFRSLIVLIIASTPVAACTYDDGPDTNKRYLQLGIDAPEKNTVVVCHAYGCKMQTPYRFTSANIAEITREMRRVKRNDSPAEERRAIAYAIGLMERQVGAALGIRDKAGMQWLASGDPTQEDCVDESTNTTSFLTVLQSNNLLRYHTVQGPLGEDNMLYGTLIGRPVKYWPHYTAVILETKTGQRWAVDSWIGDNGENPSITKLEDWYLKSAGRPSPST